MTLTDVRRARIQDFLLLHWVGTVEQIAVYIDASHGVTRELLGELAEAHLATEKKIDTPGTKVWWLTTKGLKEALKAGYESRSRKAREAPVSIRGGQFTQHMLGENDIGLAFLKAAREYDHAMDWENEVPHPLRRPIVTTDLVVEYTMGPDLHWWFVELDRYALERRSVQHMVKKILKYEQLEANEKAWRDRYPVFPDLLVVVEGRKPDSRMDEDARMAFLRDEHARLEARILTVQGALGNIYHSSFPVQFVLLDELRSQGPFKVGVLRREEALVS